MLIPIITKKRAHFLFIKRPAKTNNPAATPGTVKNMNAFMSPYHKVNIETHKGAICNNAQKYGIHVKG
jgi:hypothetical protein